MFFKKRYHNTCGISVKVYCILIIYHNIDIISWSFLAIFQFFLITLHLIKWFFSLKAFEHKGERKISRPSCYTKVREWKNKKIRERIRDGRHERETGKREGHLRQKESMCMFENDQGLLQDLHPYGIANLWWTVSMCGVRWGLWVMVIKCSLVIKDLCIWNCYFKDTLLFFFCYISASQNK